MRTILDERNEKYDFNFESDTYEEDYSESSCSPKIHGRRTQTSVTTAYGSLYDVGYRERRG